MGLSWPITFIYNMIIWARRQMHFHFDSEPGCTYFPDNVQPPLFRLNLRMCLRKTHQNINQMLTLHITAGVICFFWKSIFMNLTKSLCLSMFFRLVKKKRGLGLFRQQKCYEYNILTNYLLNFYIFILHLHSFRIYNTFKIQETYNCKQDVEGLPITVSLI